MFTILSRFTILLAVLHCLLSSSGVTQAAALVPRAPPLGIDPDPEPCPVGHRLCLLACCDPSETCSPSGLCKPKPPPSTPGKLSLSTYTDSRATHYSFHGQGFSSGPILIDIYLYDDEPDKQDLRYWHAQVQGPKFELKPTFWACIKKNAYLVAYDEQRKLFSNKLDVAVGCTPPGA